MALEEILDNLDGVDEKYQGLYVENSDGKFEINIDGLKSALAKERKLKKDLEKKLAKNKGDGEQDPDADELKNELKLAKATINTMKMHGQIKTAAISAGIDPDYIDDVVAITKTNFDLDDDDSVVVVDKDGNHTGKNVVNFFKNEFKRSKPRYYLNSGKKGTGSFEGEFVTNLSYDGRIQKAIKNKDVNELIKLKQDKINKTI